MLATAYYFALLAAVLGVLAWRTVRGQRAVAAFKALTDTKDRQRGFLAKTRDNFLWFGVGGTVLLALVGQPAALWRLPPQFVPKLADDFAQSSAHPFAMLGGMLTGMTIAALLVYFVWRFVFRRKSQPIIGDVEHLFPRNFQEAGVLVPLAINAGLSEEIMFRLALPLLATLATGSATIGFAIAAATFGLMHWYQGWKGVILTGLISYVFIALYMQFGSLLVPIVIHAAIDLLAVVVRPSIGLWLDRNAPATPAT